MVNNYYKPGPASSSLNFVQPYYLATGIGKWYITGNYMNGNSGKTSDNWTGVDLSRIPAAEQPATKSTVPFALSGADINTQTAQAAYTDVLAKAGATLPVRDAVDVRIVNETTNGTAPVLGATSGKYGIIDSPSEVGGWPTYSAGTAPTDSDNDGMPDAWETANGTNPAVADNNSDPDGDGYTNLEEYLNYLTGENTGSAIGSVITIQENSTGFCSLNGTVDNNNAGFTGTGFANTNNAAGTGITWRVNIPVTGTYVLTWRHANGGGVNRPGKLLINGAEVLSNVDLPATAGWTTWTDVSISRTLTAGQNTIRLESTTANGLSNIDYLKVSGNNPTAVSCSGVARTTTGGESLPVEGSETPLKNLSSVYPNPTTGLFIVSSVGKFNYIIFDQQGKQVEAGTAENKTNVAATLIPGIYFLKILKGGNPETLKIVKQ
jgi:hypothetical protein